MTDEQIAKLQEKQGESRKQFVDAMTRDMVDKMGLDMFRAQLIVLRSFEASDAAQKKIKEVIETFAKTEERAMCLALAMANMAQASEDLQHLALINMLERAI